MTGSDWHLHLVGPAAIGQEGAGKRTKQNALQEVEEWVVDVLGTKNICTGGIVGDYIGGCSICQQQLEQQQSKAEKDTGIDFLPPP